MIDICIALVPTPFLGSRLRRQNFNLTASCAGYQHCSILLAEFCMSTFLFLLIRSLQILRSSAYSFVVHCSPLWLMFVYITQAFADKWHHHHHAVDCESLDYNFTF